MPDEKLAATRETCLRYLKLSVLTHGQAASLLAGLNPEFLLEIILADKPKHQGWVDELREFGGHEKLRKSGASQSELLKAREKIEDLRPHIALQFPGRSIPNSRSRTGYSLDDTVISPEALMKWATEIEFELPEELQSAGAKLFGKRNTGLNPSDGLIAGLEALKAENARLNEQVARLEKEVLELVNDKINPKTKTSLQVMVLAMAREQYGWEPLATRTDVASLIASDAHTQGLGITEQTVRNQLRAAMEQKEAGYLPESQA